MKIGIFGIIIFILTFVLMMTKRKELLLLASVFFSQFYECGIAIIGDFTLQPGHYFLFLFLVAIIFEKKLEFYKPSKLLTAFLIVAFISIILNMILNTDDSVYGIGNGMKLKKLQISSQNLTQYLYLLTGYIIYIMVKNFAILDRMNLNRLIKTYTYSGIGVLLIGIYQQIANLFSLPFTAIFRLSTHEMWQDLGRTQAVFGEASFFGQYCICLLPFLIYMKNKFAKFSAIFAMLILGLLSRSTTFVIGLVVVLLVFFLININNIKTVSLLMTGIAFIIIFIISNNTIYDRVFNLVNISQQKFRLEARSGQMRYNTLTHMLGVFRRHPIIGVGYGSGYSQDMFTTLLATTGIIGSSLFFIYLIILMIKLYKSRQFDFASMLLLSMIGFCVTSLAVPNAGYLNYWVIFGISEGLIKRINIETLWISSSKLNNIRSIQNGNTEFVRS